MTNNKDAIEIIELVPSDTVEEFEIDVVEEPTSSQSKAAGLVVSENEIDDVEVTEADTYSPVIEYEEWQTPEDFTTYVVASIRRLPPTFENSKNSLRRAFRYLKNVQAEIVSGVEADAPYADLSEEQLRLFDSIEEGIEASLEQIAATIDGKMTRTATKSSQYVQYVTPFIYGMARVMINSKVSQGKNIEDQFEKLNAKYKLNDREKLELYFMLNDMGHPIRSSFVDHIDMAEQYYA